MWNNVENHILSYLLMCKDIENIGYNIMSQWTKGKVQRKKHFEEIQNETSKNIPD